MEELIKYLTNYFFKLAIDNSVNITENQISLILNFIFATGALSVAYKIVKNSYLLITKLIAKNDLHPYIDSYELENATKYYIETKGQNISPGNEHEPRYSHAFTAKVNLIKFFLKAINDRKNTTRHYIILADSGMGKTTFSINLYLNYSRKWFFKRYKIKLLPLATQEVESLIKEIPNQENTILLLDGFDEDRNAWINYQKRIEEIAKLTWKFRKVFITSRTQFFPTENLEPHSTNLYKHSLNGETQHFFRKVYISPFDDKDIKKYINKKYPIWNFLTYKKRNKVAKIIKLCPNLMVRPMLLAYIDYLVDTEGQRAIEQAEKVKFFLTASDIYKILIDRWILREANRIEYSVRNIFIENMHKFSKDIAKFIFENKQNTLSLNAEEIVDFASKNNIQLSELELKGKSLLNRDANGNYKFSHKSILEYFLAINAYENSAFGDGTMYFANMKNFDQAAKFCGEMNIVEK